MHVSINQSINQWVVASLNLWMAYEVRVSARVAKLSHHDDTGRAANERLPIVHQGVSVVQEGQCREAGNVGAGALAARDRRIVLRQHRVVGRCRLSEHGLSTDRRRRTSRSLLVWLWLWLL